MTKKTTISTGETQNQRLKWLAHRRGMLELDVIIGPFFDKHFETLSSDDQALFERLLAVSDQTLFNWLFKDESVAPPFEGLVQTIKDELVTCKR